MNPLVSVVVTTYNQAPYIHQALQSVFDQTYPNFEVIVVDDGSTDDTPTKLGPFMDRIVYVRHENRGIAASRNAGIQKAKGEFIALLDGDDLWEREKLSVQVAAAQQYPHSGLTVVDGIEFDETGILRQSVIAVPHAKNFLSSSEDVYVSGPCYRLLVEGNFIFTTSQVMIPVRVLESVGLSDTKFRLASDYDLYLRIAAKYHVTFVKLPLVRHRHHSARASGPMDLRVIRFGVEVIKVLQKHSQMAPVNYQSWIFSHIRAQRFYFAQNAYHYGRAKDRALATRFLLRLLRASHCLATLSFLIGLWCPQRVAKAIGPVARKVFGFKT